MTNPSITPANKGGCSCNFYPCIHYPATSDEWQQRVKISEILVKWHMPTRQSAISELMKLIAEETRKARVEERQLVVATLDAENQIQKLDFDLPRDFLDGWQDAIDTAVNQRDERLAQLSQPPEEGKE